MKNEQGFTLLEVIVAMAILGTGFLLVVQLFSGGTRLASASDEYLRAMALAHHKFGEMELANFKVETTDGEFEHDNRFHWRIEQEPYPSPLNDEETGVQLSQVTLTVSWDGPVEDRQIQLTSLRTEGTIRAAPDTVLIGNLSALSVGGGGNNSLTATSATASTRFNQTTKSATNVQVGPGAVPQPPPGSSPAPAIDPNFRFDISGMPIGQARKGPAPQIGVTP